MRALIVLALLLAACGKSHEPPKTPAPQAGAAPALPDETPLFRLDSNEPEIPASPDRSQAHPGPDDALKADRAGLTAGTISKNIGVQWEAQAAPDGRRLVWAKSASVDYRMSIAIFVSSNFKEDSCPYRVTWEHELSHARAYVSIFAASKVHLLAGLEHSQELEPPLPTKESPAVLAADEVADFQARMGEKLQQVVEDQARVVDTLMADHKRDRDSPEAYRKDYEKCPAGDWLVLRGGS
jgi:hypothetical protein